MHFIGKGCGIEHNSYWQSNAFSCDYFCHRSWEGIVPMLFNAPSVAQCVWSHGESCDPEAMGGLAYSISEWWDAGWTDFSRWLQNKPGFYPYDEFPIDVR